jgi:hypothetical protein
VPTPKLARSGRRLYEAYVRLEEASLEDVRAVYTAPAYSEDLRGAVGSYVDARLASLRAAAEAGRPFELSGVELREAAAACGLALEVVGHHRYRLHPDGRIEALGCPWGCR